MLKTGNGNPALVRLIRAEIEKQGPVSFAWFMQQALYHPQHGYYSSGRCVIGRKGDYFTNVSVGQLFGQLLAAQFTEIWEQLGKPDNFVIVEQGAHDGQFAFDVLQFVEKRTPEFFEALRYRIVEAFPALRERQQRTLQPFRNKIQWSDSLQPFVGVHFSNELLDAMPVRLINAGVEKFVGLDGEKFILLERPFHDEGKFNEGALNWIEQLAGNLQRGYVIAIDYGRSEKEFQGKVQVRTRHRYLDSPFEQIGHADITLHAHWPTIATRAQAKGLRIAGFTDQHHFLTGIVSTWPDLLGDCFSSPTEMDHKTKRALQTLLHPEMLGRAFQVLALAKNVDSGTQLAGLKFAREPDSTLRAGRPNE
jgi:SAM-dependent MidA family methyltransferase